MAKSLRFWTAACTLFFAAAGVALAAERQFADDNCAVTIPDSWHQMTDLPPQQGLVAAYSDDTGNRRVILQIYNKKPNGPLDDRFIASFEQGVERSGGGERLSGKYIEVGGIKSYERLGSFVLRGKQVSTLGRLVPGENAYYNVQALRFDGDASQDPEIRQVIDSFRFLHPFVPTYAPNLDSAAYHIGELVGAMGVVIVLVAVLGFAVSSSLRRRPEPLPSRPPPLPPGAQ